jgi:hypothetical protein
VQGTLVPWLAAILILVVGVIAVVLFAQRLDRRANAPFDTDVTFRALAAWAQNTPDSQLPPVVIRSYDGSRRPDLGAMRFQQEANVLATRGYVVASTSAGSYGGPNAGDILAFGLLAFGKQRIGHLTVTYTRQTRGPAW